MQVELDGNGNVVFRTNDEYNNHIESMTPKQAKEFAKEILRLTKR